MTHNMIRKDFFKYVSLNVLGMIGLSCYILADTFFVSKALGSIGIAALNFAIPMFNLLNGIGLMCGMGGGAKYTILKSQGKDYEANSIFTHSVVTALFVGIIITLLGVVFSREISSLLGAGEDALDITNIYLKTMLSFASFFILNNTLLSFVRNDGNPKLAMVAMITGSLSNILLDYVFIFPMGLGMFGAAFATCLAPIISIAILSLHFFKHKSSFKFVKCTPALSKVTNILSLGVSSFVTEISSGVVLVSFNLVILRLEGNIGVAAYGIIANIALVIIAMFTGIAQGIQPLLSNNYALKKSEGLLQILKYALFCSFGFSVLVYVFSALSSDMLIAVFNTENDLKLHALASVGIKLYFLGFFFAGFNIITAAFFSAVESPKQAFLIAIVRGFAAILPMVFLLSSLLGMNGVWLSFTLTELLTAILALLFLVYYCRMKLNYKAQSTIQKD